MDIDSSVSVPSSSPSIKGADADPAAAPPPTKKAKLAAAAARKSASRKNWEQRMAKLPARTPWSITNKRGYALCEDFVHYYREVQEIVPAAEWAEFERYYLRELPTSSRIFSLSQMNHLTRTYLEELFKPMEGLQNIELDGKSFSLPAPVSPEWYPRSSCWTYPITRKGLRVTPELKHFKAFLGTEDEAGHLNGQELVSMLPPLLLAVESHHKVLDMCAAPGSKTGQLLEALHGDSPSNLSPKGMVIGNELDISRSYMLTNKLQRMGSPSYLVTSYDATQFPTMHLHGAPLLFDRILCDVPCSGDGTIRKTPYIASSWKNMNAITLHPLQLNIASRAVELLEIGGRMIYSTCSINPLENEAVVAALLKKYSGVLELVDVSSELPGFKSSSGLSSWKVYDKALGLVESFATAPKVNNLLLHESMFPPVVGEGQTDPLNLARCVRISPHLNDTGGFFIAVLKKVAATGTEGQDPVASLSKRQLKKQKATETATSPPRAKAKVSGYEKMKSFQETPLVTMKGGVLAGVTAALEGHFGVTAPDYSLFFSKEEAKSVIQVNPLIRDLLIASQDGSLLSDKSALQIINAGVKILTDTKSRKTGAEDDDQVKLRLSQEGCKLQTPFIRKQILTVSFEELQSLVAAKLTLTFKESASLKAKSAHLARGSILVKFEPEPEEELAKHTPIGRAQRSQPLSFAGWLGNDSIGININKMQRASLRPLLLSEDYTTPTPPKA
eukprot:TRINITY_DN9265_c0_g1_i1.p1 TRINITY_DN9265_c0_g1~~TRINITY_DN9265_c0_g1_i1.p1  ORF type:complete len:749 (-),score=148.73 TRINITY_DN9265_c0_g1_i1:152-2338(-)